MSMIELFMMVSFGGLVDGGHMILALMAVILSKKKEFNLSHSSGEGVGLSDSLSGLDSSPTIEKISFDLLEEVRILEEKCTTFAALIALLYLTCSCL